MNQFVNRMLGAAKLDVQTYEDVEHDTGAMGQAIGVVVLAALAAGIGVVDQGGFGNLIIGTLAALIGWAIWAGIIYLIGVKVMPEAGTQADMGQIMRTLAFAQAPGILRIFGFIPLVGPFIYLVTAIWMIVTMVVAVRQSLDYTSTGRAVGVVILGFLAYMLVFGLMLALIGGGQPQA